MTFVNFSWPWVLGGLAVLAAGLYVLQILRIRYREVTVVSTLLWRKAVGESPVRKFREHFKHPWAYATSFAICALFWLALAQPTRQYAGDSSFHVLILDGSAGMAAGDRYEKAVAALKDRVRALPEDRRQVLWSGAQVASLLIPGEDALLLDRRLRDLKPEAAPASMERLLGDLSVIHRDDINTTEVTIFGAAPVHQALLNSMPRGFSVKRASAVEQMAHNAGITALGVSDAQSGKWDKVDVFLQAQSNDNTVIGPNNLQIDVDGKPITATLQAQGESQGWVIEDVDAQGGLMTVKLLGEADALALDNSASIRLPNKPFINVQLSATLEGSLEAVLQADPAVRLTHTNAQLVIRNAGENLGGTLPALEFVAASEQSPAFLLTFPGNLGEARFTEAVDSIGLGQIDAMALADTAQWPIEVSMKQGRQWRLSLWHELLTDDFNFTRSRAFPLFLAHAVRWLAGVPTAYPYAAAGKPLTGDAIDSNVHVIDAKGRSIDPLGVAFVPERAGALTLDTGARSLSVSLLDPATTVGGDESTLQVAAGDSGDRAGANVWVTALLLLGLLLLVAEWCWHRQGRMP
jgi:Aerotolerance regulator N-terminal